MLHYFRREIVFPAALLIVVGVLSASATYFMLPGKSAAQTGGPDAAERSTPVPVLEDAERAAGYDVKNPTWLPVGYEPGPVFVQPTGIGMSKRVIQFWSDPATKGAAITLTQDPELDGLLDGTPITIAGREAERANYAPRGVRTWDSVDIFWKDGQGGGYLLTVDLGGGISDQEIEPIVSGIK